MYNAETRPRRVYDILANVTNSSVQAEVNALEFNVECGDLPSSDHSIIMSPISGGIDLTARAHLGGVPYG